MQIRSHGPRRDMMCVKFSSDHTDDTLRRHVPFYMYQKCWAQKEATLPDPRVHLSMLFVHYIVAMSTPGLSFLVAEVDRVGTRPRMDIVLVLVLSAPLRLPLVFFKLLYSCRLASAENQIVQHQNVQVWIRGMRERWPPTPNYVVKSMQVSETSRDSR